MKAEQWNQLFFEDRMRTIEPSSTAPCTKTLWRTVADSHPLLQVNLDGDIRKATMEEIANNKVKNILCNDKFPEEERLAMRDKAFPLQKEVL